MLQTGSHKLQLNMKIMKEILFEMASPPFDFILDISVEGKPTVVTRNSEFVKVAL